MLERSAVTINAGIFIGKVKKLYPRKYSIAQKYINNKAIATEIYRLEEAISRAERDISSFLNSTNLAERDKDIIKTHLLILRDPEIIASLTNRITDDLYTAIHAVNHTFNTIVEFFAQRVGDYKDVANRIMSSLSEEDNEDLFHPDPNDVILMPEITPSRVTSLAKHGIKAYCTEKGSYNSHSSILTRALALVALTTIPDLMKDTKDGQSIILDGLSNKVIIDPDQSTLQDYRELLDKYQTKLKDLNKLQDKAAITLDGRNIRISLNLELPQEVDAISDLQSDGIGLFRTEFLYLSRNELPSEDEQTRVYSEILKKMSPETVTFRTFDLGGDKLSHLLHFSKEDNPYLGSRGLRFSLQQKELFKTQIRAILRASVHGRSKIMFPMVIDVEDFLSAKAIYEQCCQNLAQEGVSFAPNIELGVMIEIPSAALCSSQLASEADFFSIGTNDLVQYTLAVDRNNQAVARYYIQHHPAVLSLIRLTVQNAHKAGIPVSICGEMASINEYIPLLIGMGISDLSVNPNHYLQTKSIVLKCDQALLDKVSQDQHFRSVHTIETLIYKDLKPYYANT
jgi:phosphotransferase system enzyme I (PtsI)